MPSSLRCRRRLAHSLLTSESWKTKRRPGLDCKRPYNTGSSSHTRSCGSRFPNLCDRRILTLLTLATRRQTHSLPGSTSLSPCSPPGLSCSLTHRYGTSLSSSRLRRNSKMMSSRNCWRSPCERRRSRRRRPRLRTKHKKFESLFPSFCFPAEGWETWKVTFVGSRGDSFRVRPCTMSGFRFKPKRIYSHLWCFARIPRELFSLSDWDQILASLMF